MEAAALVENSRTVDELESYFKAYTDLPREVVLKHDLLRDGHWFTTMAHSRDSPTAIRATAVLRASMAPA